MERGAEGRAARFEHEIEELRQEIEEFQREKERIRSIVGQIGGVPILRTKIVEVVILLLVILSLIISLLVEGFIWRLAMIEVAIALVSFKLIIMMRNQARVTHFQLWILSSLEWRLNEIIKSLRGAAGDSSV